MIDCRFEDLHVDVYLAPNFVVDCIQIKKQYNPIEFLYVCLMHAWWVPAVWYWAPPGTPQHYRLWLPREPSQHWYKHLDNRGTGTPVTICRNNSVFFAKSVQANNLFLYALENCLKNFIGEFDRFIKNSVNTKVAK